MIFSLFTKKKKNTDYNEMENFIEKEDTEISEKENNEENLKKARKLLQDAINIFT